MSRNSPPPAATPPKSAVLSLDNHVMVLIVRAANKITSDTTRVMGELCGIGAIEWRTIAMLAIEPGITVSRAAQALGIDKAAVSRSLSKLKQAEPPLVKDLRDANARNSCWHLTEAGQKVHDRIVPLQLTRESELTAGIDESTLSDVKVALHQILKNLHAQYLGPNSTPK